MKCTFLPVEVGILGVLHFGITNAGIQEQTMSSFSSSSIAANISLSSCFVYGFGGFSA
jgi:hypothetical protein